MSVKPYRFIFRTALLRRFIAKALIGFVELSIVGGTVAWLWNSEQRQNIWVWMAVGIPLFFAYVFIGGYVRYKLGLMETSADGRSSASS